ncbi:aminotransferase class V-fold PLP-dependent enzyme [Sorangium sp. So ce375]|uniref:aminotransferase class V-fold PLP-dependent enzyme n=1 Tax=Sorangium sp. So ce375 TaxID=3133306 RepID=UPI003F5C4123
MGGERGMAGVVGLNAAVQYHRGVDRRAQRPLYEALRSAIAHIPGVKVIAPGSRHSGIVSFVHDVLPAERIVHELSEARVNTWLIQGSHTPVYLAGRGISRAVRASAHHYSSFEEVDVLARALRRIVSC